MKERRRLGFTYGAILDALSSFEFLGPLANAVSPITASKASSVARQFVYTSPDRVTFYPFCNHHLFARPSFDDQDLLKISNLLLYPQLFSKGKI